MFKKIDKKLRELEIKLECLDAINYWKDEFEDIDIQYGFYSELKKCVYLVVKIPSMNIYEELPSYVLGKFIRTIRDVRDLNKCNKCDGEQKHKGKTKK